MRILNRIKSKHAILDTTVSSDGIVNGIIVDTNDAHVYTLMIIAGKVTSGSLIPILQECDEPTFTTGVTDVEDYYLESHLESDVLINASNQVGFISYFRKKRYLRASFQCSGGANLTFRALWLKSGLCYQEAEPVVNP